MLHPKTDDPPRTLDDFCAWHERQPEVYEFINGVAKAMAPGFKAHTVIKGNLAFALRDALAQSGRECHVLVDGAIVEGGGSSLIPDVLITCSPLDFSTPRVDEPVVVDVLSPSTEKDDVIRKLPLYFGVPTIRHVLIIHQDRRMIVHHERRDDLAGRFLANLVPDGSVGLDPPGVALAVEAVYAGLPLDRG